MITAPGTYAAWAQEGRDTTKGPCTPAGWGWSLTTVLLGLLAGGRTWALRLVPQFFMAPFLARELKSLEDPSSFLPVHSFSEQIFTVD